MITPDAALSIQRIPLRALEINEYETRYMDRLLHYVKLLTEHPGQYAGFLSVVPSDMHSGRYVVLDGHHRLVAAIMTGRRDVLAVVIEEPKE